MRTLIAVIGILGLLSPALADLPGAERPGTSLLSTLPSFQLDDWGGGGGGGGGDFDGIGPRLSATVFLSFIFPKSEQSYDIDSSSARPPDWPYYYNNGIGGTVRLSYLLMPSVRVGGSVGFEHFDDKTREYEYTVLGTDYVDTYEMGPMSMFTGGIHVDFMIPVKLPTDSWFSMKKGFVEGLVPYVGWEGATAYRIRVRNTDFWDFGDQTWEDEVMKPYFTFINGLHAGAEFRTKTVGFFFEVGYLWYSPPKKGKDLWWRFRWDWMVAAPIRGGVVYYF
ncbi:MAG: hypothetical protein ACYS47_03720 [Planctomycetota bacterium]|jgi:hypothetical protein